MRMALARQVARGIRSSRRLQFLLSNASRRGLMSRHSQATVSSLRLAALVALALGSNPAPTIAQSADLTAAVGRMAKVGRASSPTFSPDGRRIAFVSDLIGVPQIWTVPVEGGWPTLVTADNDPVGGVAWSP